jgi:hypothetical protein
VNALYVRSDCILSIPFCLSESLHNNLRLPL